MTQKDVDLSPLTPTWPEFKNIQYASTVLNKRNIFMTCSNTVEVPLWTVEQDKI